VVDGPGAGAASVAVETPGPSFTETLPSFVSMVIRMFATYGIM
jgi:hypothetical protein